MRDLWEATAMVADNRNGIVAKLENVTFCVDDPDLNNQIVISANEQAPRLNLKQQPTQQVLEEIDRIFREEGLNLSAYELAEINRWFVSSKDNHGETLQQLRKYWEGLGEETVGLGRENPGFLQAVGAMSFDGDLRHEFANGANLVDHGFKVPAELQDKLRAAVRHGEPADLAAARFFNLTWSGPTCLAIKVGGPGWRHLNA